MVYFFYLKIIYLIIFATIYFNNLNLKTIFNYKFVTCKIFNYYNKPKYNFGEYRGCGTVTVPCFSKKSETRDDMCAGALSWCNIQELLRYKIDLFLQIASRIWRKTFK